jgi:hypothetical protein
MAHTLLHAVRKVRTFSLTTSCRSHPFAWYAGLYAVFISWANYAQYKRLAPMFPKYDKYLKEEGGRMLDAKRQELAEVGRYNNMVGTMRRDIAGK